jgi:hypothetical protein
MDENAGFVDHSQIQRTPVLEEGQIDQLVVDREIVVFCIFVRGG